MVQRADKNSSLVQIGQATLSESSQSQRVTIVDALGAVSDLATETTLDAIRSLLRGKNVPHSIRNDYSVTNVLTSAYVQLIASTSEEITELDIFDSSGNIMVVAFGAVSSEVDQFYISPGGNGKLPVSIPAGTRVSVKAVSANSTVGDLIINFFGS